jgi:putative ABC transport system ATP-binding protein
VLVGGVALSGMSRNERARLRRRSIGYVFQDFNLLAGLTTAENVALPLELDGVVGDRRLLLADEPSGALDSVNAEAVMRLVRVACRQGMAGVVVTHDEQLASWADRVVFLRDGRVTDQTTPPPGPESLLAPGQSQ